MTTKAQPNTSSVDKPKQLEPQKRVSNNSFTDDQKKKLQEEMKGTESAFSEFMKQQAPDTTNTVASHSTWKFTSDDSKNYVNPSFADLCSTQTSPGASSNFSPVNDGRKLIQQLDGGLALRGINLFHPGSQAENQILQLPSNCSLRLPLKTYHSYTYKFSSTEESNDFLKIVENSGYSFAINVFGLKNLLHGSLGKRNNEVVEEHKQQKKQNTETIQFEYVFVPKHSFEFSLNDMKLSTDAEQFLATKVTDAVRAQEFLHLYNSHVAVGLQHIGGIFIRRLHTHRQDKTATNESTCTTKKTDGGSVGGSFLHPAAGAIGIGISGAQAQSASKENNSEKNDRESTGSAIILSIGPAANNVESFIQALGTDHSSWHIIDRDELKKFVPVWEVILKLCPADPRMMKAARLIRQAWLKEAEKHFDIPYIPDEIQKIKTDEQNSLSDLHLRYPEMTNKTVSERADFLAILNEIDIEIHLISTLDFNSCNMTVSVFLAKCASIFTQVNEKRAQTGYDLLMALMRCGSLTNLLVSIKKWCDVSTTDIHPINSYLSFIFTPELLKQFRANDLQFSRELISFIQSGRHTEVQKLSTACLQKEQYFNTIFNIPTVPVQDVSRHLKNALDERISNRMFNLAEYNDYLVRVFDKSTTVYDSEKASDSELKQFLNILKKYGWSQKHKSFPARLTQQQIGALLESLTEIFFDATDNMEPELPQCTEPTNGIQQSNVANYLNGLDTSKTYTYTDWIVDRPLAPGMQPVLQFIDDLRHRLSLHSVNLGIKLNDVSNETCSGDVIESWLKKRRQTPVCSSGLPSSFTETLSIYDVLINLINNSDLLSVIELFRLLLERRSAVPILIPSPNSAHSFKSHINALLFVAPTSLNQRYYHLGSDRELVRICIISMRPIKHSESGQWAKDLFSCHSIASASSHMSMSCITDDKCVAELGIGFIPYLDEVPKIRNVLLLHVIGYYPSIWPFIQNFVDILLVEEDTIDGAPRFELVTPLKCKIITWKSATTWSDPEQISENQVHFSGTLHETIGSLQDLLVHIIAVNADKYTENTERKSLDKINLPELYAREDVPIFDIKIIVSCLSQDYSKLRREELILQQIFIKEADEMAKYYESFNNDAEQMRSSREVKKLQEERRIKAEEVYKHPLISIFIKILQDSTTTVTRTLSLQHLSREIIQESQATIGRLREEKDAAFNALKRDKQKKQDYYTAKRAYTDAAIGTEHLWREIAHIYESDHKRYTHLPGLAAQHLIDGFVLELLDGDAGMVQSTWIKSVFYEVNARLCQANRNPPRIFVLSVLGVQSSGKSTLLNLMFGTRLNASSGQCTRGVYIQLLKSERPEYDYIFLLDTEGIRAPEYTGTEGAIRRDNKMAIFSILPADATIILTNGEDDSAAQEVISIVQLVHEQSELAASATSESVPRIFIVYTRVDTNQTDKLIANVQEMYVKLQNNIDNLREMTAQKGTSSKFDTADNILFHDFRSKVENGEIGGDESDVKFLGKLKKGDIPPDDVPNPEYGQAVVHLSEYIYHRVTRSNKWKSRDLRDVLGSIDKIWQCAESASFIETFKSAMDVDCHNELQKYLNEKRKQLARIYSEKYNEIQEKIYDELSSKQSGGSSNDEEQDEQLFKEIVDRFQADLRQLIRNTDAPQLITLVPSELESTIRWDKWHSDCVNQWKIYCENLERHTNLRILEAVTSRLRYDKIYIHYQKEIRKKINESYAKKNSEQIQEPLQNEMQKNEEFDRIFDTVLTDAEKAHPRVNIERRVLEVYRQNSLTQQFNIIKLYKDVDSTYFIGTLNNIIDRFKKYFFNRGLNQIQTKEFLTTLFPRIDHILQSTNIYSDCVVEEAITVTNTVLQQCKFNKIGQKKQAHRLVFAMLVQKLEAKQNEWETKNLISVRLRSERDSFRNLYNNTIAGMNGLRLLTSDLKAMFAKNWRNAYKDFICKKAVNHLQSASWVSNHRVLSAYADEELLELIQKNQIQTMIDKVIRPHDHYNDMVNKKIQILSEELQREWPSYRDGILVLALNTAIAETKAYTNPEAIDENNRDTVLCNEGRYDVCDNETDHSEWNKVIQELINVFPFENSLDSRYLQTDDLIASIKEDMIKNQQNQSVRLRCGNPCPLCKSPCTGPIGHDGLSDDEKRHNCEHQPGGIAGGRWEPTGELYHYSCTQGFFANHTFKHNNKWILYKKFDDEFKDWKSPEKDTVNPQSKVRQFIFYNYQTELHERYPNVKPCTCTPNSYNHIIEHLLSEVKTFLGKN